MLVGGSGECVPEVLSILALLLQIIVPTYVVDLKPGGFEPLRGGFEMVDGPPRRVGVISSIFWRI